MMQQHDPFKRARSARLRRDWLGALQRLAQPSPELQRLKAKVADLAIIIARPQADVARREG